MELDKNFKELCESLKVTQLDMAMFLDVTRVTLGKWEDNPDTIPLGKYEQLMNELKRLKNIKEK